MRRTTLLAALVIGLAWVDPSAGAVLTVTDCGDTTPGGAPGQLRRLITDAAAGDTIVVPACIVTLTGPSGATEDANESGDLDVARSLTIQGAGARRTILDAGTMLDRVLHILPTANVTLADVMLRGGTVPAGMGGGILNAGVLAMERVVVANNAAFRGGGIANEGSLTAVDTTVTGNRVTTVGGIAGSVAGIANRGFVQLTRSTVSGNVAAGFRATIGGIGNDAAGSLFLIDSTVSGNGGGPGFMSGPGPGGIASDGYVTVSGSAIVANSGAGLASSGLALVGNTIVADNLGAPQCVVAATFVSGGNLATDTSCPFSGVDDAVVVDAGLGALGDHGGPTQTHPLMPGSPAVDTVQNCGPIDQRGRPRPHDRCDKGPYEFYPPLFADVAPGHVARGAIEALFVNGMTGGCSVTPRLFCPDVPVTRGQIAVLLLRALNGAGFTPPPATGLFVDVPVTHVFAPWIDTLFDLGISRGCDVAPARFCPDTPVTREQVAVLLLRTLAVSGFVPFPASGLFVDVPASDTLAPWIEEFFHRGLTAGCQGAPPAYCPDGVVTRGQAAVFLVRAFGFGF